MKYKPLIIGVNHHNTYSLIRCFGEAGLKVDVVLYDCADSYIGHSIYIDKLWYCEDLKGVLCKIRSLVKENGCLYAIFSATDADASILDLHYDELQGNCLFFNAGKEGAVTYYMDKEVQTNLALEAGFAVPKTLSFSKGETINSQFFPCLIKPLASIDGGKRIAVCHNQEELEIYATKFSDVERLLVQQFIEKDQEIVILGMAVDGKVIIPGYIIKYRDIEGGTTYSSTAPINELGEDVVASAEKLVHSMNYNGLFGIECIKSKSNYWFIEINLRNDATTYSLAVAGANLPLIYMHCAEGKSLPNEIAVRHIFSMVEIRDIVNVFKRKVGLFTWLKQRKKSECKYNYDKNDICPYKLARREFVAFLISRLLRR